MSQLSIPNDIVDGTLIEASEHQQNYKQIESFVNDQVIHADGSVAMDAGAELLLGKNASVPLGAVTKAQLDNAVGGDVAGGGFLPLGGGTLTGKLIQRYAQDVSGPGTGGLLVGYTGFSSTHIAMDGNEIQAYASGVPAGLNLNIEGTQKGKVTVGGDLQVNGAAEVGGKQVVTEGQLYTKKEIDDLLAASKKEIDDVLAARPLMKLCDKPTRVYDARGEIKCLAWHKVQLPSTVGGIARSGAKAAYLNMTSVNAVSTTFIAVRPDGSNWDPNNPSSRFATLNLNPGATENEHFLTEIGSNGAIQFWIHGSSTSEVGTLGIVVDVIALVF